jgi:hypothetical protein
MPLGIRRRFRRSASGDTRFFSRNQIPPITPAVAKKANKLGIQPIKPTMTGVSILKKQKRQTTKRGILVSRPLLCINFDSLATMTSMSKTTKNKDESAEEDFKKTMNRYSEDYLEGNELQNFCIPTTFEIYVG